MDKVIFSKESFKSTEILKILRFEDSLLTPPLSRDVDIEEFSFKLARCASFLVGRLNGRIVAFMAYYINDTLKQIYITYICVHSEAQHSGVGSKMVNWLVSNYSNAYHTIGLEVAKVNDKARTFYDKLNFLIAEDRGFKLLMVKSM